MIDGSGCRWIEKFPRLRPAGAGVDLGDADVKLSFLGSFPNPFGRGGSVMDPVQDEISFWFASVVVCFGARLLR